MQDEDLKVNSVLLLPAPDKLQTDYDEPAELLWTDSCKCGDVLPQDLLS